MPLDYFSFEQPWLQTLIAVGLLILLAVIANWVAKQVVLRLVRKVLAISPLADEQKALGAIVRRLSNIVPAVVIQLGIGEETGVAGDVADDEAAFLRLTKHVAAFYACRHPESMSPR